MGFFAWHSAEFKALLTRKGQLPHALLLRGREGIGKLAFAEALAGALLCESPTDAGEACGRCAACGWLEQGSHPDLRRLAPEALREPEETEQPADRKPSLQIQVDQVRQLADFVNLSSHRSRAKLVLIHPAESLNVNAANALLKSLEEPPPGTYFLLVAHRWQQLLPTIRSRCQHIALGPPDAAAARAWLETRGLREPELCLAQAGGAPLVACQFDDDYWRSRAAFLGTITAADFDPLRAAERLRECAPALALAWLQKWSFDLAFHRVAGRVRYNPDFAQAAAALASRLEPLRVLRFHRAMVTLQRIATHPLNPRLFLEQLLLRYARMLRDEDARRAA